MPPTRRPLRAPIPMGMFKVHLRNAKHLASLTSTLMGEMRDSDHLMLGVSDKEVDGYGFFSAIPKAMREHTETMVKVLGLNARFEPQRKSGEPLPPANTTGVRSVLFLIYLESGAFLFLEVDEHKYIHQRLLQGSERYLSRRATALVDSAHAEGRSPIYVDGASWPSRFRMRAVNLQVGDHLNSVEFRHLASISGEVGLRLRVGTEPAF